MSTASSELLTVLSVGNTGNSTTALSASREFWFLRHVRPCDRSVGDLIMPVSSARAETALGIGLSESTTLKLSVSAVSQSDLRSARVEQPAEALD